MSLTKQTIILATSEHAKASFTMPAEHIYPFLIHRTIDETREKERGKREKGKGKEAYRIIAITLRLRVSTDF